MSGSDKRTVLVIDDQELVRRALRRSLELLDCEVRTAADGRTGLSECISWRPKVVIVDVKMPRLHGDDLARVICDRLGEESPAMFVLTGEPTYQLGRVPGVVGVFTKPVHIPDLYRAMEPYFS